MFLKKSILIPLIFSFFVISISSCSSDDSSDSDASSENGTDNTNGDLNAICADTQTTLFIEENGVLDIEFEKTNFENTNWSFQQSIEGASGDGYLVWTGDTFFGNPGNGLLTYNIRIATPGTYKFIWRSYITIGDQGSEHNDSWLRIPDADHFYGMKNDGHIVYPKETTLDPIPESAGQTSTLPNGSGSDGWFKAYMNTQNTWKWNTKTSDNDAHNIYVVFDTPGDYTIEVSGRSTGHAIDRFVLFTEDHLESEITGDTAINSHFICE
ncbi:hypothetical protein [uncultured Olleya sp.]|uniref:hypothetical protein n=1 Tax=uncultured Olleya sp. TaxID=757243 RepID=UPI0025947ED7|nr:hypothetical protein [uncultured Olleya sp.]